MRNPGNPFDAYLRVASSLGLFAISEGMIDLSDELAARTWNALAQSRDQLPRQDDTSDNDPLVIKH
jgi:hypothetical protein